MNAGLHAVVLRWGESRVFRWLTGRRRPHPPSERMSGWTVWAVGVAMFVIGGVPFVLLTRPGLGRWSLSAAWLPGGIGFFAGVLGATMIWLAWNRRAARLDGSEPPKVRLTWLQCLVLQPVLVVVLVGLAALLATGIDNRRGDAALAAFQADLQQRGEPLLEEQLRGPAVAVERNLVEAPVFQPLLVADTNAAVASSTGLSARAIRVDHPEGPSFVQFAADQGRKERTWVHGGLTDLPMWQAYFRSNAYWPQPSAPANPAADVLVALGRFDRELAELRREAAARPEFQLPAVVKIYEDHLAYLANFKALISALRLRASVLVLSGRGDDAVQDVLLGRRITDGLSSQPLLITELVRIALETHLIQPIWDGCQAQRWNDAQLQRLMAAYDGIRPVEAMRRSLQGERVYGDRGFVAIIRNEWGPGQLGPFGSGMSVLGMINRGWMQQNRVNYGRYLLALTDDLQRATAHADLVPQGEHLRALMEQRTIYNLFAAMMAPAMDRAEDKAFESAARLRLALVGMALERQRLAEGSYPEDLSVLAPRFLAADRLLDPMTGKALAYRRDGTNGYRLYSLGTDHVDQGGAWPTNRAAATTGRRVDHDLVWR